VFEESKEAPLVVPKRRGSVSTVAVTTTPTSPLSSNSSSSHSSHSTEVACLDNEDSSPQQSLSAVSDHQQQQPPNLVGGLLVSVTGKHMGKDALAAVCGLNNQGPPSSSMALFIITCKYGVSLCIHYNFDHCCVCVGLPLSVCGHVCYKNAEM